MGGDGRPPGTPGAASTCKPGTSASSRPPPVNAPPHVLTERKVQPPLTPASLIRGAKQRGGRARGGRGARSRGRGGAQEKEKPTPAPKQKLTVQHLWRNTEFKSRKNAQFENASAAEAEAQAGPVDEDDDQEDEDMVVADTFADYEPAKLTIGKRHPDPVIETASMASVLPPNITYTLHLPEKIIANARLSSLQLESVTYACQQHEFDLKSGVRSGYLIGDGAGVGKGRTIAGIIYENWLQKRRKSIWISVSADLKIDSRRDLDDIGATMIKVHPLNKLKYGKINQFNEGVIFATYSALIGHTSQGGKYNSRLKQLVKWCGKDFDGPIIFDECHRAKNLCQTGKKKPTKTGLAVHELQAQLPSARIVYASATGASEPKNMAYMTRLGIWGEGTPFVDFSKFLEAIEKRGVGAMEIVAMDMKLRGAYIARQLSFKGVTFTIDKVPLEVDEIKVYDDSVELWVEALKLLHDALSIVGHTMKPRQEMMIWAQFWGAHQRFFKYLCIATKVKKAVEIAKAAVKAGKCAVIGLQSTGEARTLDQLERDDGELIDFVSTAKGVFQSMVEKQFPGRVPFKPSGIDGLTKRKPGAGISLIGFFDDDEDENDENEGPHTRKRRAVRKAASSSTKRVKTEDDEDQSTDFEGEESDFVLGDSEAGGSSDESCADTDSDATTDKDENENSEDDKDLGSGRKRKKNSKGRKNTKKSLVELKKPSKADMKSVHENKAKLLEKIESLGERLPPNTLDELIHQLGGPNDVAEMTGRKGRVVRDRHGNVTYETRAENDVSLETVNLAEKDRFMKGDKLIAIISEAASSGISLQSDRRAKNQRRRVHITLELPWSADRAIQQFGRTHRSNQVNSPEYVFLISDLAGEHRFASIVAKRLESLGALTHGDRRATESRDLSQFHIDNKYGRLALDTVLCSILKRQPPVVPLPKNFEGDFCQDVGKALLGVEVLVGEELHLGLPEGYKNISKFLNRILGVPVRLQNQLFQYFIDSLAAVVKQAKKTGRYDAGILDLSDNDSNEIIRVRKDTFERQHATGVGLIELHELKIERGLSWEQAMAKYEGLSGLVSEGFYLSKQIRNNKTYAIFAISDSSASTSNMFTVYRPNTGLQLSRMPIYELREKYNKVIPEKAKESWENQYNSSKTVCQHAFWSGNCKQKIMRYSCDYGLRQRTYHVLSGSVLLSWGLVENVLQDTSVHGYVPKMQIIRVRLGTDDRIVGILIPNYCAEALRQELERGAVSTNSQGMGAGDDDMNMDDDDTGNWFHEANTVKSKAQENTAEAKAEDSDSDSDATVWNDDPVKFKAEEDTVKVMAEENTVKVKAEENTVKVKAEENTVRVNVEENTVKVKAEEGTVKVKVEENTVNVKAEDSDSDATVWDFYNE